jgi:membrane dipeptidase
LEESRDPSTIAKPTGQQSMKTNVTERVATLHRKSFIIDAHFDLPLDVAMRRERGERRVIETSYIEDFRAGGVDLVVGAIFIHDYFLPEMGLRRALDQITYIHEELEESPGLMRLCRTMGEAQAAREAGEVALILSLEGADPLQNDLGLLRIFYELGVRALGLVWSRRNFAADGAFFKEVREGRKGGLTPYGVKLVERAEQLGMVIDLSHINDEGFADVMEIAGNPVVASHSNCRRLADTKRNLTDRQIEMLAENGGVMGMNSVNMFVAPDKENAAVADLLDHVDHVVGICGIDHVGIGFDICNGFSDFLQLDKALPAFDIVSSHRHLPAFTSGLTERGYSDEAITAILGGNFHRVYQKVMG